VFQRTRARRPQPTGRPADPHPASDYKCFNSSNVSIHPWSWNYRGCWHQTCPPVVTHSGVWIASIASPAGHKGQAGLLQFVAASPGRLSMGQFACLLPTLVVVAISQAPSPESNPDSPSPVTAPVVHYTTVTADRSGVCTIKQCCGTKTTTLPAQPSRRDQPESATTRYRIPGAGLLSGWTQSTNGQSQRRTTNGCRIAADLLDRVLATRFWRISKRAPGQGGAVHTLSWK